MGGLVGFLVDECCVNAKCAASTAAATSLPRTAGLAFVGSRRFSDRSRTGRRLSRDRRQRDQRRSRRPSHCGNGQTATAAFAPTPSRVSPNRTDYHLKPCAPGLFQDRGGRVCRRRKGRRRVGRREGRARPNRPTSVLSGRRRRRCCCRAYRLWSEIDWPRPAPRRWRRNWPLPRRRLRLPRLLQPHHRRLRPTTGQNISAQYFEHIRRFCVTFASSE
jgi:hypothetical protein